MLLWDWDWDWDLIKLFLLKPFLTKPFITKLKEPAKLPVLFCT